MSGVAGAGCGAESVALRPLRGQCRPQQRASACAGWRAVSCRRRGLAWAFARRVVFGGLAGARCPPPPPAITPRPSLRPCTQPPDAIAPIVPHLRPRSATDCRTAPHCAAHRCPASSHARAASLRREPKPLPSPNPGRADERSVPADATAGPATTPVLPCRVDGCACVDLRPASDDQRLADATRRRFRRLATRPCSRTRTDAPPTSTFVASNRTATRPTTPQHSARHRTAADRTTRSTSRTPLRHPHRADRQPHRPDEPPDARRADRRWLHR